MKSFGIRIKTAGSFFADIVPEFEYFACRKMFKGEEETPTIPLFELSNQVRSDSQNGYFFSKTISVIRTKAVNCAKEVIARERDVIAEKQDEWIYQRKNKPSHVHAKRIFTQHIGYLKKYCEFVEYVLNNDIMPSSSFDEIEKKPILQSLKNLVKEYEIEIRSLRGKRKDSENAKYINFNVNTDKK
ncbi:MAG: hypothetical protein LBS05_03140 [Tannerellaceae bacterium]|nr:hypothetical protein [Tannerellaceae bacterium]